MRGLLILLLVFAAGVWIGDRLDVEAFGKRVVQTFGWRFDARTDVPGQRVDPPPSGRACRIKGNISANGRIYHVPGQRFYSRTIIDPSGGERWFCTEADARAAGWRKSRV